MIAILKSRTLGNSPSRLQALLQEQHTEQWMSRSMLYLGVMRKFPQHQATLRAMPPVPGWNWLFSVYVREACTRLEETKARVTSVFGEILKMDSTKQASFYYNIINTRSC